MTCITKTAKKNYYCAQTKSKHSKFELLKKGFVQLRFILMWDKDHVYVEAGGHVVQLNKEDGSVKLDFMPARHRSSNVCVGGNTLITGSCPTV